VVGNRLIAIFYALLARVLGKAAKTVLALRLEPLPKASPAEETTPDGQAGSCNLRTISDQKQMSEE
jgi:hypothetical protein